MTKHTKSRIGLTKGLKITVANTNEFKVFGDSIGTNLAKKSVYVTSVHHNWNNPPSVAAEGNDAIKITAYCHPRHANSDDDLTITITEDPTSATPDTTTITFPDVEYSD